MHYCRMALSAGLMLLTAACSSVEKATVVRTVFTKPTIPPIAEQADPRLSNPPRGRDMSQTEVTDLWNADRSGLKVCLAQKHAAVSALKGIGQ